MPGFRRPSRSMTHSSRRSPGRSRRARLAGLAVAALAATTLLARDGLAQEAKLFVTSPLPIVLGEVEKVSLVIEVPETPETEGRPLQISTNVGRVDPPESMGPGRFRVTFYAPTTKFPQAALLAVWRETGPDARVDFLRLPLSARTKLPVKAPAGAETRVFVGADVYGPVTADRKGNAAVPIVVPPGVKEVVVETLDRGGERKRSNVPVKVPSYNRVALAATPYISDSRSPATVHVYYDEGLAPPPIDRIRIGATVGAVKPLGADHNRYRFEYRGAPGIIGKDTLSASVVGDDRSSAQHTVQLGEPVADRLVSRTSSTSLMANGRATKVIRALAVDKVGLGVPGIGVRATTSDGKLGELEDAGNGYYEAVLTAPATMPRGKKITVELYASPPRGLPLTAKIEIPIIPGGAGGELAAGGAGGVDSGVSAEPSEPVPSGPRTEVGFGVGIRAGAAYDAQISPLVALELSLRPAFADRRLALFLTVEGRTMSASFTGPQISSAESTLSRLPVMVGASYDLMARTDWRGYVGAAGGVVGVSHSIETQIQEPQTFRRLGPVAEVLIGASYSGVFLELAGTFMSISDRSLEVPSIGASASLGYRLGLF